MLGGAQDGSADVLCADGIGDGSMIGQRPVHSLVVDGPCAVCSLTVCSLTVCSLTVCSLAVCSLAVCSVDGRVVGQQIRGAHPELTIAQRPVQAVQDAVAGGGDDRRVKIAICGDIRGDVPRLRGLP